MINFSLSDLQTGDVLLFHSRSCISKIIQCCTCSYFSHVGIILRDPIYIDKKLKGIYLFHSSVKYYIDAIDNVKKSGVQITHIDEILKKNKKNNLYVRKIYLPFSLDEKKILNIYNKVVDKPYNKNLCDWLRAEFNILKRPIGDTEKYFWCSALVGYFYNKMGLLSNPETWTLLTPEDWSGDSVLIRTKDCHLGKYRLVN